MFFDDALIGASFTARQRFQSPGKPVSAERLTAAESPEA
ncbi:protein of unknown function [Pararobbsia alpina]